MPTLFESIGVGFYTALSQPEKRGNPSIVKETTPVIQSVVENE